MSQLNYLLSVEVQGYDPKAKEYTILNPVKAVQRLARRDGWVAEKVIIRHLASGNDEHLHVLSRPRSEPPKPAPAPAPTVTPKAAAAATKVRETIYGKRNAPRS